MLRSHRLPRFAGVFLLLALILAVGPTVSWAQGVGTIKGTIRDAETGDFLDYANVLIKGTTRGTMSVRVGAAGLCIASVADRSR